MFEVRNLAGELLSTSLDSDTALARLETLPNAYFILQVVEVRRLVKIKDDNAPAVAEAPKPF